MSQQKYQPRRGRTERCPLKCEWEIRFKWDKVHKTDNTWCRLVQTGVGVIKSPETTGDTVDTR